MKTPVIGYILKIKDMDARKCVGTIRYMDGGQKFTLTEKDGYLVDCVAWLEEHGVDRYEMIQAVESMMQNRHDIAHFGMAGTFIFSDSTHKEASND